MTGPRHIAVIDIGKTNAKLALVDLGSLTEIAVVNRPNIVRPGPPWPHYDTEGHWSFILDALTRFHAIHRIDAISITTHGASIALLDASGDLAAPILDYEHDGPASTAATYSAIRPPFDETGSPRLANGLNVGAQLHWQFSVDPGLRARTAQIVTYPQYWAHRLSGVAATELTSLGCHTDLWLPREGRFSTLVDRLGIADKFAPVRKSDEVLGQILCAVAETTGLARDTPVVCGIHDSNASLYPHIMSRTAPFSVVSTGTWVIAMAIGGSSPPLDPARDTLLNVDALGRPVPSARFMGGREFDLIQCGHPGAASDAEVAQVLDDALMLLPSVVADSGPFQGSRMRWTVAPPPEGSGRRFVILSFYLALMTAVCLRLTGAAGPVIVEGPLAGNALCAEMLAAATGRLVVPSRSATGTSIGAAMLAGQAGRAGVKSHSQTSRHAARFATYAREWRLRTEADD